MENGEFQASILSSSVPIKGIDKSNKPLSVDFVLDYGINKINEEKFEVISLKGHSIDQIGIITLKRYASLEIQYLVMKYCKSILSLTFTILKKVLIP